MRTYGRDVIACALRYLYLGRSGALEIVRTRSELGAIIRRSENFHAYSYMCRSSYAQAYAPSKLSVFSIFNVYNVYNVYTLCVNVYNVYTLYTLYIRYTAVYTLYITVAGLAKDTWSGPPSIHIKSTYTGTDTPSPLALSQRRPG